MLLGIIGALIAAIGWGSYFVPLKKLGKEVDIYVFQFIMCSGILLSSLVFSLFFGYEIIYPAIISGFVWAIGNILSAFAVKRAGLAIAPPIWMGTGIFVSFFLGVVILLENVEMLSAISGVLLLVLGIYILSLIYGKGKADLNGIILALLSGLIFGSYLLPLNFFNLKAESYLFSMSLGIFLCSTILLLFSKRRIQKELAFPGIVSGVIWNIANIGSLFAVNILGLAIGFPLTQLALFVSIVWGIVYFKEFREKRKKVMVLISAIILFSGALLLGLSKI